MKVLKRGMMKDGTKIQIEEWNEDYHFMPYGSTLATYPISKASHKGAFSPKGNEIYRFSFDFESMEKTEKVFNFLISGEKSLIDFKENLTQQKYANCL